ncbi:hypothetical protein [Bacillus sp. (in: firmicutes)]|uniref:hypothetical protein n=1 Tax=Bacillus sp. TaxID=1409 RepID=UPI0029163125|nr:hypothetical protein [Bacillus sp. (in: firmicutes)]
MASETLQQNLIFEGRSGSENAWELFYNIFLFSAFGASPNLSIIFLAFVWKKQEKEKLDMGKYIFLYCIGMLCYFMFSSNF